MRSYIKLALGLGLGCFTIGCGRQGIVNSDALPLKRVVVYRNGVAYFERGGHVDPEVRFKMKEGEVGDFLATLAVMERGGSSVRSAAFPLKVDDDNEEAKPRQRMTDDEKKGMKVVVLSLDGKDHDLQVGYVAESPVWRPSYRLVVQEKGEAELQAWGIVQNLSGEDWKNVNLSLVAGAPLAFEAQLGVPVIPTRPTVTDNGEVIAAVPRAETSLNQERPQAAPPPPPAASSPSPAETLREEDSDDERQAADKPSRKKDSSGAGRGGIASKSAAQGVMPKPAKGAAYGPGAPPALAPAPEPRVAPSAPRDVRSLAAVAIEAGTTRYDLPTKVTVPDKSATMVMLLSRRVPGEANFLFAPDGGVPDSSSHPFRVARFSNKTGGTLEKGPIAVFEAGSFLGQGMVDPLPDGATATVPFALERAIAVDQSRKYDEQGARIAKIENGELTVERDSVTQTTYRLRNGGDQPAKILVKHSRMNGTRLFSPPKETEDNVGTHTALVPATIPVRATTDLVVDERATLRRSQDWFSVIADNAFKAYVADPRADKGVAAKLTAAWATRNEIVAKTEARQKLTVEQNNLQQQTEETRRNLRAIEKNKAADALRVKLTQRLGDTAVRLDEITKQAVEIDAKLAELRVRFKESIRDLRVEEPLPPQP